MIALLVPPSTLNNLNKFITHLRRCVCVEKGDWSSEWNYSLAKSALQSAGSHVVQAVHLQLLCNQPAPTWPKSNWEMQKQHHHHHTFVFSLCSPSLSLCVSMIRLSEPGTLLQSHSFWRGCQLTYEQCWCKSSELEINFIMLATLKMWNALFNS